MCIRDSVCGIKVVDEDDDLILISNEGVIIRIAVKDVNVMSRYASGVRVMRLSENDSVVTFARAEHVDEETEEVEAPDEEVLDEIEPEEAETAETEEETTEE